MVNLVHQYVGQHLGREVSKRQANISRRAVYDLFKNLQRLQAYDFLPNYLLHHVSVNAVEKLLHIRFNEPRVGVIYRRCAHVMLNSKNSFLVAFFSNTGVAVVYKFWLVKISKHVINGVLSYLISISWRIYHPFFGLIDGKLEILFWPIFPVNKFLS